MCCISYKSPYYLHVFTKQEVSIATFTSVMRNELLECFCLSSNIVTHHGLWKKAYMRSPLLSESLACWISFVTLNIFQTHFTRYFNWHKLLRKWFKLKARSWVILYSSPLPELWLEQSQDLSYSYDIYVLSRFSHIWFFVTLWTIARCQSPLSMRFSR